MLPGPPPTPGWKLRATLALVAGCVASAPSLAAAPADVEAAVRPQPLFLWEVAAGDDPAKLYLLGATHLGRSEIRGFDPAIEAAFDRSDVLAVEANVPAVDEQSFQEFMLARGTIDDGTTLPQWLPAALSAELLEVLSERRNLPTTYDALEPWLVSLMLSAEASVRAGYRRELGMEPYFMRRAAGRKRIEELEGARHQIELLDAMPREVQTAMLERTVRGLREPEARGRAIEALWRSGDAPGMEALLFSDARDPARRAFLERMYFSRNRAMAERLERSFREPGVWFSLVGAGHLVGDRGIPALLARAGYRVRQIEASAPSELAAQLAPD
jgi:uncharacterized protein